MKSKKGQAAMEFLLTYGWAILIVILICAALGYFGVFDKFHEEEFDPEEDICEFTCEDLSSDNSPIGVKRWNKECAMERLVLPFDCLDWRQKTTCEQYPKATGCTCDEYEQIIKIKDHDWYDGFKFETIDNGTNIIVFTKVYTFVDSTINELKRITKIYDKPVEISKYNNHNNFNIEYTINETINGSCIKAHKTVCVETCKDITEEHCDCSIKGSCCIAASSCVEVCT